MSTIFFIFWKRSFRKFNVEKWENIFWNNNSELSGCLNGYNKCWHFQRTLRNLRYMFIVSISSKVAKSLEQGARFADVETAWENSLMKNIVILRFEICKCCKSCRSFFENAEHDALVAKLGVDTLGNELENEKWSDQITVNLTIWNQLKSAHISISEVWFNEEE